MDVRLVKFLGGEKIDALSQRQAIHLNLDEDSFEFIECPKEDIATEVLNFYPLWRF